MVVHLAAHSYYSLLAGIPKPSELAAAAAKAGQPAIALTDHNRLSGSIEFTLACQAEGIKPILGMDVTLQGSGQMLTLLAADEFGWASLCKLSSWLLNELGGETQPLPIEGLQKNQAGLLCLAAPRLLVKGSLLEQSPLTAIKEIFGERLYLQLPRPNGNAEPMRTLAKTLGVPLVANWPIYYLHPEQAELQRTLAAMRLNVSLDRLPAGAAAPAQSYFPTSEEMQAHFAAFPAALAATEEVAARCQFALPLDKPNFPELQLPGGQAPIDALRQKAYAGARKLYPEVTSEIAARLEHELEGISASGYTTLFLIMEEIVSFAREADVPLSSRGSAASSLVAHCLGITTPDPVRLNLYFERFLNPARPTPPDIDTDICSLRRDIVIRHVYEHYGHERVAMVATINRFRRRSALREVAKAHGLAPAQIKSMVDTLPYRFWGPPGSLPEKDDRPYGELEIRFSDERSRLIFKQAEAILDAPHHLSIHPGGIVISSGPLNDLVPTQYSGKGVTITQYDLTGVQRMGLVKMDLLGIRGLTVLGDVADQIRALHPEMGNSRLEILEKIPDLDVETADNVRNGRTIGCFQIESPGMRATLKEVQSDSIDNVMVALALFRPGPLTGGFKDAFVRRHLGKEPVHHLHPALGPLLEETHGVFLYQEQVLRVAHELAGFSLAESDLLRRAMSHFDPGKRMQTLKEKFIGGAMERSGLSAQIAERVWDLMAAFSGYGFPKAHAASYALTAWRSAWCKTHYPAEFMAAVLANWGGYYSQGTYLLEARRLGLTVRAPHINYSQSQFSVAHINGKAQLFMGLDQLHDLTHETQERIMRLRPFESLADLLTRAFPRKGEARNLIEVGGLEGLGSIPNLLDELESGTWKRGQMPLFGADNDPVADWTVELKAATQERLLGVSLVAHPLDVFAEEIKAARAITTVEAANRFNQELRVAGMRQTWRRVETSAGNYLYFMDLADLEGTMRVVIPDEVYLRHRGDLAGKSPLIIEGRLELGRDSVEPILKASRIERLDKVKRSD
jgi:DNA-directed DNA polymerase III PolC